MKLFYKWVVHSMMLIGLFISSCTTQFQSTTVNNVDELHEAVANAEPGAVIEMTNGEWTDVRMKLIGKGIENNPIIIKAETPGKVIVQGDSDLKIGGEYLVIDGLYFKNGRTPSRSVIEFRIDERLLANNCKVINCVIEDYNQSSRSKSDLWVQFWGRHNELSNCYLAGKSNRGPTVRVSIRGNESINNYHRIVQNHFGPRPPKGGPSAETIQLGASSTSMSPSHTLVANNLFEKCNGEVEVISSKTNFNEFRNNVFYKSEGSLVTRHGNYCIIDGNYFIGDSENDQIGGIRIINTGHWVTNNYFYNLKAKDFRSPLAIMNGIPRSPLNRYMQVTDVVVAHNTWINCVSPWQFGVGSNVSQSDVLPASEIRSARPVRTTVANNLIYNHNGDKAPLISHDKIDGINFKNNYINNKGVAFEEIDGLTVCNVEFNSVDDYLLIPGDHVKNLDLFRGFDFESIKRDIFGNSRSRENLAGAMSRLSPEIPKILDRSEYGADWFSGKKIQRKGTSISVNTSQGDLSTSISQAQSGDTLVLIPGVYNLDQSLVINKRIIVSSENTEQPAQIIYSGQEDTPAFELNPKGHLILDGVDLKGGGSQVAFASLKNNMSGLYNLDVKNTTVTNFRYILKAYKESMAHHISFDMCVFKNCRNGIELAEETDDRGDYNAENIVIKNCEFENITNNVIEYYRGGYDESTIGGNLVVMNSSFTNCGAGEKDGILLNTYGIVYVDITANSFVNNPVDMIALLWGAKNNFHSGNEIKNSGKIVTEENLKLRLVY